MKRVTYLDELVHRNNALRQECDALYRQREELRAELLRVRQRLGQTQHVLNETEGLMRIMEQIVSGRGAT